LGESAQVSEAIGTKGVREGGVRTARIARIQASTSQGLLLGEVTGGISSLYGAEERRVAAQLAPLGRQRQAIGLTIM